jgi:hypothetical protein
LCRVEEESSKVSTFGAPSTTLDRVLAPLKVSCWVQMDWIIPEKLKKGVSYSQFSTTLY